MATPKPKLEAGAVKCPCCRGSGTLKVFESDQRARIDPCCHCHGTGKVYRDNRGDNRRE